MPNETRNATTGARTPAPAPPGDPARRARIAIAAYYRAERRGFTPGRELEDWLEAERQVDRGMASGAAPATDTAPPVASEPAVPADAPAKAKTPKSRGGAQRTTRR